MNKKIVDIIAIIFLNLFAFLFLGVILGVLFGSLEIFLILSMLVSIAPLLVFLYLEVKKTLKKLSNISGSKKNDTNSNLKQ